MTKSYPLGFPSDHDKELVTYAFQLGNQPLFILLAFISSVVIVEDDMLDLVPTHFFHSLCVSP